MKPIKLKIAGVKSFSSEVEIDFSKLLKAGMFGIFGDTGSGKSTILESIFCSLYSSKFKTEYVNKRSNFSEITFTFELVTNGERTAYEVYRKFVKSGQPKAVLYEYKKDGTKISIAEKQRQVDDKICEILGLNAEEFESSIVLPQGRFDKFLNSTRINRIKIMESLFGLQKYGENLKENIDKLNLKYVKEEADLKGKLSMLEDVNLETLTTQKEEFEKAKNELDEFIIKNNKINDYIEKYSIFYNGEKRLKEVEYELKNLKEKSPYFTKVKENLEKLNSIKTYVSTCENFELKTSQNLSLKTKIEALNSSIKTNKTTLKNLEERIDKNVLKIDEILREISELKVTVEKVNSIKEKAQIYKDNHAFIESEITKKLDALNFENQALKSLKQELNLLNNSTELFNFEVAFKELETSLTKNAKISQAQSELDFLTDLKNYVSELLALSKIDGRQAFLLNLQKDLSAKNNNQNLNVSHLKELLDKKIEVEQKVAKVESEILLKEESATAISREIDTLNKKLTDSKNQIESFNAQINKITGGKDIFEHFTFLQNAQNNLEKEQVELKHSREVLVKELSFSELELATQNAKLDGLNSDITNLNLSIQKLNGELNLSLNECRKIISEVDSDFIKNQTEQHFKKLLLLEEEHKKLTKDLKNSNFDSALYAEYLLKKGENQLNLINLTENFAKIKNNCEKTEQNYKDKCIIDSNYIKLTKKMQLLNVLTSLVSSRKLLEFIADEYLTEISNMAKKTLFTLSSGKYGLTYDGEFFVTDNLNGGEKRQASTLSGGETFIVSLSLALALSTEIHQKSMRPIEFFFLDEGFGTLDKNLTETVISCLDKLKNQNFTIGLISHVDELKDAVNARIDVYSATYTSGSTVKITAN